MCSTSSSRSSSQEEHKAELRKTMKQMKCEIKKEFETMKKEQPRRKTRARVDEEQDTVMAEEAAEAVLSWTANSELSDSEGVGEPRRSLRSHHRSGASTNCSQTSGRSNSMGCQ